MWPAPKQADHHSNMYIDLSAAVGHRLAGMNWANLHRWPYMRVVTCGGHPFS